MSFDETVPPGGRHQRRMRSLLLDRRFQLKYTGMILGLATLISAVLGTFLFRKVRENSRLLELEGGVDALFQAQLADADNAVLLTIVGSFVIFLVLLTVLSIFITHRMAGPIYVMRRHVKTLARGSIPQIRALRRGDEFGDFYETLVRAVAAIEHRTHEEVAVMSDALEALKASDAPQAQRAVRDLSALLEKKKATLESAQS